MEYLGYDSESKQIYQDIDEAMFSLRWLNYIVYQYKTKSTIGKKSKTMGNFIYNMTVDNKSYTLWINKVFVGCIAHVLSDETAGLSESDKRDAFSRGYYNYPTAMLPMTKDYSTSAYLLTHFLVLDSGNSKLNDEEYKVVAYSAGRFMDEAGIRNSRPERRMRELLKALAEVEIIARTEPPIDELELSKPAAFDNISLRIYIKK